jgi:hypothetical protein
MNTQELTLFCLTDPYIRKCFGGVIPADKLPVFDYGKPKVFIVNTEKEGEDGEHWICIFTSNIPEYFDSLGQQPQPDFVNFLINQGPNYLRNTRRVQDYYSNTCGLYCLFYAYFRCRRYSFQDIMDMFSYNLKQNEFIVKTFYQLAMKNIK